MQYIYTKNGLRKESKLGDMGSGYYVTSYSYDTQNRPGAISHAYGTSGSRFAGVIYDTLDELGNPKVVYESGISGFEGWT